MKYLKINKIVEKQISFVFLMVVVLLLISCDLFLQNSDEKDYAEKTYADFADSVGDNLRFEVLASPAYPLNELSGKKLNSLVTVPDFWYELSEVGTSIVKFTQTSRTIENDDFADANTIDKFEEMGLNIEDGKYRMLNVIATLNGTSFGYESVEFCWSDQGKCLVADPYFLFLDTYVKNKQRLINEGWEIKEEIKNPDRESYIYSENGRVASTCVLASNRKREIKKIWPAYSVWYNNFFGKKNVNKDMGRQEVGITCLFDNQKQCRAASWGTSAVSSCWTRLGWRCACGNIKGTGGSSATNKFNATSIAETKCTHRWAGSVKADVKLEGSYNGDTGGFGANVDAVWDVNGAVDSNGGTMWDACGSF